MSLRRLLPLVAALACLISSAPLVAEEGKPELQRETSVIHFEPGKWNKTQFRPTRLSNQAQAKTFAQLPTGIGTTFDTFNREDYKAETDNAILLYDLANTEAEFAVTF